MGSSQRGQNQPLLVPGSCALAWLIIGLRLAARARFRLRSAKMTRIFGLQIAVIACGWGLTTKGGPKEVGSSTTGAVVMILVTVALMDALLTKLMFA